MKYEMRTRSHSACIKHIVKREVYASDEPIAKTARGRSAPVTDAVTLAMRASGTSYRCHKPEPIALLHPRSTPPDAQSNLALALRPRDTRAEGRHTRRRRSSYAGGTAAQRV